MISGRMLRSVVLFLFLCLFINAVDEESILENSARRQQFTSTIEPNRCGFEPLLSFGNYFFARYTEVSWRSTVLPYTKNSTIVISNLLSFSLGILIGFTLTLYFYQPKSKNNSNPTQNQDRDHNLDQQGALQEKKEDTESEDDDDEFLEKSLSLESWNMLEAHSLREASKKELSKEKQTSSAATLELCKSIQNLTLTLQTAAKPMSAILQATETIADEVGIMSRLTGWMAGRKSKKDKWIAAMDNLSFGVVIMNLCLGLSSTLFGRWQDWGVGCESLFSNYSSKAVITKLWCYIHEPYVFFLGCVLWYSCAKFLSTSGFLKKREALPTLLLIATFGLSGLLHSTIVSLLGGSWHIAFFTWILYSGFLVKVLDNAKECPVHNESNGSLNHGLLKFFFSNDTLTSIVSVFIFPVLVSTLPFWNKGLSTSLYYSSNRYWREMYAGVQHVYMTLCEYGMY